MGMPRTSSRKAPRLLSLALLGAAALLLLAGLGRIDVNAPDEPRYLEIADELRSLRHGVSGLVVLHLNDAVYTQKPPLYFWLAALLGARSGDGRVSEGCGRLPSALSGWLSVALTLVLGRKLLGFGPGLLGAALLLSTFDFAFLSRRIQLDVLLTLLETAALASFWQAERSPRGQAGWIAAMHACMGAALLTKGPVGFLIPSAIAGVFLIWEGRASAWRRSFPLWALALSLGPALVWLGAAIALAPEGFAADALGHNLLARFFSGSSHVRPFYYYGYALPGDFLPWTLLWPLAWRAGRQILPARRTSEGETTRAWRLLVAWVGVSLVFFSISAGKRGLYLLPAFPAGALLCADGWLRSLRGRPRLPRGQRRVGAAAAAGVVAIGLATVAASRGALPGIPSQWTEPLHRPLLGAFGWAGAAVGLASALAWTLAERRRAGVLVFPAVAVSGVAALELAIFLLLLPALEPIDSPRPIARAAAELTPAGQAIGLVGHRALVGALRYYGRRPVVLLDTPLSLRRFADRGGRAIVVRRRSLERVSSTLDVRVYAELRSGRRAVLVVRPTARDGPRRGGSAILSGLPATAETPRNGGGL